MYWEIGTGCDGLSCMKNRTLTGALAGALRLCSPLFSAAGPTSAPKRLKMLPRCARVRNRSPPVAFNGSHGEWLRAPHQSSSSSLRAHPGMSRNALIRETINQRTLRKPLLLSGSCARWTRARVHCELGLSNSLSSVSGRAAVKSDPA